MFIRGAMRERISSLNLKGASTRRSTDVRRKLGLFNRRYFTQALVFSGLFVSVMCIGLAYGARPVINSTFVVNSFGPKSVGLNIGLATTPMMVGVIIGPYPGSLVQMSYGYYVAIVLGGLVALVGVIAAFFCR
jgi:predicted MFS family arabinose efflux permease